MQPYALCKELMEKNVNPAFEHFKSSNAEEVAGRGKGQNWSMQNLNLTIN